MMPGGNGNLADHLHLHHKDKRASDANACPHTIVFSDVAAIGIPFWFHGHWQVAPCDGLRGGNAVAGCTVKGSTRDAWGGDQEENRINSLGQWYEYRMMACKR